MASALDVSSLSSASSTTTGSTVAATSISGGDDDVLMRRQVFSGTLRPAVAAGTKRRRKAAAESVSFQPYTLTHVTNAASVDVAISYCVLTSSSGDSTTISTSHIVTSLADSAAPTLCIEDQVQEQPRSTLSRFSPWRKSKPARACFEAESVEDLEMWFCWIRRSLQPKSEFLPVTVSSHSASTADPYCGPALMTLREGCIIGIVQASTLNLLEVIRINVITAFGNEDDDTTLWLTVCPACRAGPAFLDVASESTRYACKYAFQPATEEIHHALYGHLEDVCSHVCGRIWKIPDQRPRPSGDTEVEAVATAAAAANAGGADGSMTNGMICSHSSLCLNGAWKLPLSNDLVSNIVAPVICDVWKDLALRAGYSGPTVESWADQFDAMLVFPAPGEPPKITVSQEAIVFLKEWQRTTENDSLHQLVRLMKALDLAFELNLMLWALYNERVQTRPDSPMQLRFRKAAHSVATSSVLDSDDDNSIDGDAADDADNEDDIESIESRLVALMDMSTIPGDEVRFLDFTPASSSMPISRTPLSAESDDLPMTPTILSLDNSPENRVIGNTRNSPRQPTTRGTPRLPGDQQEEGDSGLPETSSHLGRSQSPLGGEVSYFVNPRCSHDGSPTTFAVSETNLAVLESQELGGEICPTGCQYSFGAGSSWLSYCGSTSPLPLPPPSSGLHMMEKGCAVSGLQLCSVSGEAAPLLALRSAGDGNTIAQEHATTQGDDSPTSHAQDDDSQCGGGGNEPSSSLDESDEPHQPLSSNSISHDSKATWMANRAPECRVSPETCAPAAEPTAVRAINGDSPAVRTATARPPPLPATPPASSPPSSDVRNAPQRRVMAAERCDAAPPPPAAAAERPHYEIGVVAADNRHPLVRGLPHTPPVTPITSDSPLQSIGENSDSGGRPPVVRRRRRRHSTGGSGTYVSAARIARYQAFRRNASTSKLMNRPAMRLPSDAPLPLQSPSAYLDVTCNGECATSSDGGRSVATVSSPLVFVDQWDWSVVVDAGSDRSQASSFVAIPTTFVDAHTSQEFEELFKRVDSQWSKPAVPLPSHDMKMTEQPRRMTDSPALSGEAPDDRSTLSSLSPAIAAESGPTGDIAAAAAAASVAVDDLPALDLRTRGQTQRSWLLSPIPRCRGPTLDRLPSKSMRQGTIHRLAQHVSEHHTNDWLLLAYELGFTFDEVVEMETGCTRVVERVYRMVQAWLERNSPEAGAKRTLVAILHDLNWQDSADVLSDLLVRQCSFHYMSTSVADIKGPYTTSHHPPVGTPQHYEELDE